MAKFGFIILVLLFGLFSFIAGVMAPPALHQAIVPVVEHTVEKVAGLVGADMAKLKAGKDAEAAAKTERAKSERAKTGSDGKPTAKTKSTPLKNFRLGPAEAGPVGISVGLYATEREARMVQNMIAGQQIASQIYQVSTGDGLTWMLLAAGPYKTEYDGIEDKERLRYLFGMDRRLDFVRWLKPPKAAE